MNSYVYFLKNENKDIIYIGTTRDSTGEALVKKYRNRWWADQVHSWDMTDGMTQGRATYLKEQKLQRYQPRFNAAYINHPDNLQYQRDFGFGSGIATTQGKATLTFGGSNAKLSFGNEDASLTWGNDPKPD